MGWKMRLVAACVGALLGCATGTAAAATPAFDPVLSLTGSCNTSALDEIPDPGLCPMPPGVSGIDHPSVPFEYPGAVTTDAYGNVYVGGFVHLGIPGSQTGKIDIFSPKGKFLTEITDKLGPMSLAVDSEGSLYVTNASGAEHEEGVVRYDPILPYDPAEGKIEYANSPTTIVVKDPQGGGLSGLAVDPTNDHLFVKSSGLVSLYKSASEGNELIEGSIGEGLIAGSSTEPVGIAVDAAHERLYLAGQNVSTCPCVYALELKAPHKLLYTITGAAIPAGNFVGLLPMAADEGTGDLYVYDVEARRVYRLETDNSAATYLETIEHGFRYNIDDDIHVDNGAHSPNGALNPRGRYLFVTSEGGGKGGPTGHSYAFAPPSICPPEIDSTSFDNIGEAEAELRASIEPCGLKTHYVFEYLTEQQFKEQGDSFTGAQIAGEGEIPVSVTPVPVAAAASGLQPGTTYRFRVMATNEEGPAEGEGKFATYPVSQGPTSCPNEALRSGPSTLLPDCRAYELVTPPDTNARAPRGSGPLGAFFAASQASVGGDKVSFALEGGSLPGAEAVGSLFGDPYLSTRGGAGWSTEYAGSSGAEASSIQFGSTSPDLGFSLWRAEGEGTAVIEGETNYVRYPDGHSALVGRGSEGTDPRAQARLISENGGHIIFISPTKLEPNAPPNGTKVVYDRTADEVTHVVSLLPGDETPKPGESPGDIYGPFEGASPNGKAIAIKLGETLYVRYDNEETYELGENVTFAGFAKEGTQAFYVEGGDLYRFEIATEARTPFTALGDIVPVNVSDDGSTAYFASPTAVPGEENPNHEEPGEEKGKWNLYRSHEGTISFVGVVAEDEILAEEIGVGLGLWAPHVVRYGEVAEDPSRTTPDGNTLLFESHARLTSYDSEGQNEVYRYDFAANKLDCLSCNPTLAPAEGGASLQSIGAELFDPEPLGLFARIDNLSSGGDRVFFQSTEALVPGDNDGLQDVYEWEAQGVGSCKRPQGCLDLISSGHSGQVDYLFAVSNNGDDVFFRSGDILLRSDREQTASVYDARVNGGFPEPEPQECEGEGCRPGLTPAPPPPSLASGGGGPSGNADKQKCPKGKRQVRRHGKVRCIKKHHKRHHQRKAGTKKKGAGK
jgi:sugar lactone lactonase YvrE